MASGHLGQLEAQPLPHVSSMVQEVKPLFMQPKRTLDIALQEMLLPAGSNTGPPW